MVHDPHASHAGPDVRPYLRDATLFSDVLIDLTHEEMSADQRVDLEKRLCAEYWHRHGVLVAERLWGVLRGELTSTEFREIQQKVGQLAEAFHALPLDEARTLHADIRRNVALDAPNVSDRLTLAREFTVDYVLRQRALADDVQAAQREGFGHVGHALAGMSDPLPPAFAEVRADLDAGVPFGDDPAFLDRAVRTAVLRRQRWADSAPTLAGLLARAAAAERPAPAPSKPVPVIRVATTTRPLPRRPMEIEDEE